MVLLDEQCRATLYEDVSLYSLPLPTLGRKSLICSHATQPPPSPLSPLIGRKGLIIN